MSGNFSNCLYIFLTFFNLMDRGGNCFSIISHIYRCVIKKGILRFPLLRFLVIPTAAVQTKVQWYGEDQNDRQHVHGCCWAEWDTRSRKQSGTENDVLNRGHLQATSPLHINEPSTNTLKWLNDLSYQDKERQQAQIGIVVEFAIAMIGKLDGINRHSFNNFRLRVGEVLQEKSCIM